MVGVKYGMVKEHEYKLGQIAFMWMLGDVITRELKDYNNANPITISDTQK